MYKIEYQSKVRKDLRKIPAKTILRIKTAIQELAYNPFPNGVKKLVVEYAEFYRIRMGNYRIIYSVENDRLIIIIVKIRHRKDVYDKF